MLIAGLHFAMLCSNATLMMLTTTILVMVKVYAIGGMNDTSLRIGIKSLKHKTQEQVKVNLIESCVSCFVRICNIISE